MSEKEKKEIKALFERLPEKIKIQIIEQIKAVIANRE